MFVNLKERVDARFSSLMHLPLFRVQMENEELFNAYLTALPEEVRQEHTCHACRHFLNRYGNVVAIDAGKIMLTLWDFKVQAPYTHVPKVLEELVRSRPILEPFLSGDEHLGVDSNRQQLEDGSVIRWQHLYFKLPKDKVKFKDTLDRDRGEARTTKEVFERALKEITVEACQDVFSLINDNALYRGKEFEASVQSLLKHIKAYANLKSDEERMLYSWYFSREQGARVRNTAIGALLQDLSEGKDTEQAVRAFESMVAPANYRRPTSLVTAKMVEQAQEQIEKLGFSSSLRRRHATADDIPLTSLLFVNRAKSKEGVFDSMKKDAAVNPKQFSHAKAMTLEEFLTAGLAGAERMELLLQNDHAFMSLIAPEDPDAPSMFSWGNPISWTYQNNLTDALREKVKAAGGSVTGEFRASLEWFNYDDLDLHLEEPNGGDHIYFGFKHSRAGGTLDVDMNAGRGTTKTPVENITYPSLNRMRPGSYRLFVHNYCKRENEDFGFNVDVEFQGQVYRLSHAKAVPDRREVEVATFMCERGTIYNFKSLLNENAQQREVQGLLTNTFQRVKAMLFSPNHWDREIGNKHLFFILEGAKVETPLRPFFNEYLQSALQEHRKVLEILGGKLMVEPSETQMSGVGFSLTQHTELLVRVNGNVLKVHI